MQVLLQVLVKTQTCWQTDLLMPCWNHSIFQGAKKQPLNLLSLSMTLSWLWPSGLSKLKAEVTADHQTTRFNAQEQLLPSWNSSKSWKKTPRKWTFFLQLRPAAVCFSLEPVDFEAMERSEGRTGGDRLSQEVRTVRSLWVGLWAAYAWLYHIA